MSKSDGARRAQQWLTISVIVVRVGVWAAAGVFTVRLIVTDPELDRLLTFVMGMVSVTTLLFWFLSVELRLQLLSRKADILAWALINEPAESDKTTA